MENNGWIKLHRKALDSEVWQDYTAFRVFMYLLLKADYRTGKTTIGRFIDAKILKLKPTTFYQALKRLENNYKIVNLLTKKVSIKYTEVTINKWHLYQVGDRLNDNPMTIRRQSNDTIQEVKKLRNKEYEEESNSNKKSNPVVLSKSQVVAFLKAFPTISTTELKTQMKLCNNFMAMSSQSYKDPGQYFRGWLKNYLHDRAIAKKKKEEEKKIDEINKGIPQEVREKNLKRIEEIRKQVFN